MRRALSITLLIAFLAPIFGPPLSALTTDPEASLPACCRSHGAHHCALMHSTQLSRDSAPTLTPSPCPLYPTAATVPQVAAFAVAAPPQLAAELPSSAALPEATARRAQLLLARTRRDRGPPSLLA